MIVQAGTKPNLLLNRIIDEDHACLLCDDFRRPIGVEFNAIICVSAVIKFKSSKYFCRASTRRVSNALTIDGCCVSAEVSNQYTINIDRNCVLIVRIIGFGVKDCRAWLIIIFIRQVFNIILVERFTYDIDIEGIRSLKLVSRNFNFSRLTRLVSSLRLQRFNQRISRCDLIRLIIYQGFGGGELIGNQFDFFFEFLLCFHSTANSAEYVSDKKDNENWGRDSDYLSCLHYIFHESILWVAEKQTNSRFTSENLNLDNFSKSEHFEQVTAKSVTGICTLSVRRRSNRVNFCTRFSYGRAFRRAFGFAVPTSGSANSIRPITRDLHLCGRLYDNRRRFAMSNHQDNCVPKSPIDINDITLLAYRIDGLIKIAEYLAHNASLRACEEHRGIDCLISSLLKHSSALVSDLERYEIEQMRRVG